MGTFKINPSPLHMTFNSKLQTVNRTSLRKIQKLINHVSVSYFII